MQTSLNPWSNTPEETRERWRERFDQTNTSSGESRTQDQPRPDWKIFEIFFLIKTFLNCHIFKFLPFLSIKHDIYCADGFTDQIIIVEQSELFIEQLTFKQVELFDEKQIDFYCFHNCRKNWIVYWTDWIVSSKIESLYLHIDIYI